MNTIEEILKNYTNKLNCSYVKANTKSKMKRITNDLFRYSNMCHKNFFINDKFAWEEDIRFQELFTYDNNILKENILNNKDIYLKISDNIIKQYIDTSFPLYKSYIDTYREYHEIQDNEMIEIILSFLNKFDYDLFKTFKEKINDSDIFMHPSCGENFYGATCDFDILKKNLMFINTESNGKSNIRVAATIMHEYGHSFEMDLYHKNSIDNNMYSYPFYEVSSQFFEYAFIEYLLDNKIYYDDTKIYRRMSNIELFYFMLGMNLFSEIEKVSDDEYSIDSELLEKKETKIHEKVNYYGACNYEFDDFDRCFIYGLGYLFSPYLYENYKQDPNNFMKEFKNTLLAYPHTNSINTFERVGVTEEILIKGNTLKKVLKNSR